MTSHFSKAKSETGTELVEFAFAITILLSLMFGIIGFAQAAYAYHFVSHAAREATRYASVRGSACTLLPDCGIEAAGVTTYVQGIAPIGINKSSTTLIVNASWPGTGGCPPGPSNAPGCPVTVNVQYHFTYLPMLRLPPFTISSTSQLLISQ